MLISVAGNNMYGLVLNFQAEQDSSVSDVTPHIINIGRMVEDMENKIRNTLNDIYFGM